MLTEKFPTFRTNVLPQYFLPESGDSRLLWIIAHLYHTKLRHIPVQRNIRGGADKSLARPGRKQAIATKLGIYSTYSPRSSIHFLARCSKFASHSKKKSEDCPSNQVSAAAIPKVAQTTGTVDVFDPPSGISGPTSRRTSACTNLHEWWTQPAHGWYPVAQVLI
jgi:hypothetical protein